MNHELQMKLKQVQSDQKVNNCALGFQTDDTTDPDPNPPTRAGDVSL